MFDLLVGRAAMEPATTCLRARCSYMRLRQLSQGSSHFVYPIEFADSKAFTLVFQSMNQIYGETWNRGTKYRTDQVDSIQRSIF